MFGLPIGRRVAPLLVFSDYDYRCAPQETHASPLSPPHMKPAVQAAHGSSLFRKKSRFTTGSTSFARDASNGDPAASLSPPNDRPLTSSAQSRRGSRGSSISSINDLNPAALRRRSTSFRKNPQASISTDMLASAGGRDNRPPTAGADARPPTLQRSASTPAAAFERIQGLATKRIQTLGYLKKAHEGRTYFLNTLYFNRNDLAKLPYFDSQKLSRRANNYFILGNSISAVLDPISNNLMEYMRTWSTLLVEFDGYMNLHPPEGSTSSALPRVRMPQMFKRTTGGKGRRSSGMDATSLSTTQEDISTPIISHGPSFSGHDRDLLPGEDYAYLLTPFLPFDLDYFECFATLCDVLIDCYTTILTLVSSPELVDPVIDDLFNKADMRVKKILMTSLVRDMEFNSKQGLRVEMAGVAKVVLNGLM